MWVRHRHRNAEAHQPISSGGELGRLDPPHRVPSSNRTERGSAAGGRVCATDDRLGGRETAHRSAGDAVGVVRRHTCRAGLAQLEGVAMTDGCGRTPALPRDRTAASVSPGSTETRSGADTQHLLGDDALVSLPDRAAQLMSADRSGDDSVPARLGCGSILERRVVGLSLGDRGRLPCRGRDRAVKVDRGDQVAAADADRGGQEVGCVCPQ